MLGPRPYPVKESVIEYLQELRARKTQEDELANDEDAKRVEEERKAAIEATKFDPNAEDPSEESKEDGETEKEEVDAAEPATNEE